MAKISRNTFLFGDLYKRKVVGQCIQIISSLVKEMFSKIFRKHFLLFGNKFSLYLNREITV